MSIPTSLAQIHQQIIAAAKKYHRVPEEIKLVAVSKKHTVAAILQAYAAGQCAFAENYLQEAITKIKQLQDYPLEWHFIGPIQANKTALVAASFAWVHTIDRIKIAHRLNDSRNPDAPPLNVCIQVNVSAEISKSGVDLSQVAELAVAVKQLPRLNLRGLMAIPVESHDFSTQRYYFRLLKQAQMALNEQYHFQLDTLSMGMSNDFVAAIAEGANILRIGTAIFGERDG